MNILQKVKSRFGQVLSQYVDQGDDLLEMIRPAQDAKFGDYQANCAMPLGKQLGKPPRELAEELLEQAQLSDFVSKAEVAGPGFINITLDDQWLADQLMICFNDLPRLGVLNTEHPKTIVIDFSSPNVAKPMHVGHIRSTVIGDCLARVLRFLGHRVETVNHLGDWGTQFGMIIYGYKHFLDAEAFGVEPVAELSRVYLIVRKLIDYHSAQERLAEAQALLEKQQALITQFKATDAGNDKGLAKKLKKDIKSLTSKIKSQKETVGKYLSRISTVDDTPELATLAPEHADIGGAVLQETANLHEGDSTNIELWNHFIPLCLRSIDKVYQRLDIKHDHTQGESFYHEKLAGVVEDLQSSGMARESEGAICVFLDEHDAPMIVRKSDGAFLYATTDLATVKYRMETWDPDAILYVVDFRQGDHFAKLFDVAKTWHYPNVEFKHVEFGTVMGSDGKPFKTRAGDTVGLEPLLDEAESRALAIVSELDDSKPNGPEFDEDRRTEIATIVGIGALKYADLSQNRSSDYTFSYDKMVSLKGNTATYLQYGYARVNGIFRRGGVDPESIRAQSMAFQFTEDVERLLAIKLLRFEEALTDVTIDYRPNLLANYLFDLTQTFFVFFEKCPVLKSDGDLKQSRLQFCDLTARTLKQGLSLMGISVVPQM